MQVPCGPHCSHLGWHWFWPLGLLQPVGCKQETKHASESEATHLGKYMMHAVCRSRPVCPPSHLMLMPEDPRHSAAGKRRLGVERTSQTPATHVPATKDPSTSQARLAGATRLAQTPSTLHFVQVPQLAAIGALQPVACKDQSARMAEQEADQV